MDTKVVVGDLMSTNLIMANRDAKFSVVKRILEDNDIHHIPVVEGTKVVGMVSSKDITQHALLDPHKTEIENLAELDDKVSMDDIMNTSINAVDPDMPINQAAEILFMSDYHGLPVCDNDRNLVGMLTSRDIVKFVKDYFSTEN